MGCGTRRRWRFASPMDDFVREGNWRVNPGNELSTTPKKALGGVGLWDRAKAALASAMDDFAGEGNWRVNLGDGAFYGPKIDIKVMDAMDCVHQCATIQLDFQLPIRFDPKYRKKGGLNDVKCDGAKAKKGGDDDEGDRGAKVVVPARRIRWRLGREPEGAPAGIRPPGHGPPRHARIG